MRIIFWFYFVKILSHLWAYSENSKCEQILDRRESMERMLVKNSSGEFDIKYFVEQYDISTGEDAFNVFFS